MATKPLVIPNVFASEGTGTPNNIPLLDADFTQVASYFNDGSFFSTRGTDTGGVNAYVVTQPTGYVPSQYNPGMRLVFSPANANTGAATINVNALGSVPILKADGTPLTGGEITALVDTDLVYDGTNFRLIGVTAPQITLVRLKSFNAVGNPNFEVNQVQGNYGQLTNPANNVKLLDRWYVEHSAVTAAVNVGQGGPTSTNVPGTSYNITNANLQLTLTTPQATLAAGDYYVIQQSIEGPMLRELINDVHSISLLVYSTVANVKFSVILRDAANTHSLAKLCTVPTANAWTLVTLPNIPVWTPSATWSTTPGNVGYLILISLACGSTYLAPANDTWQNASYLGAIGMTNWLANSAGTILYFAFVQHEPGQCTTLIDCPFSGPNGNLEACLRYYQKTYSYGDKPGTATQNGAQGGTQIANANPYFPFRFYKPMAKTPTVTLYSPNSGASGVIYNYNATADLAGTATLIGDAGFQSISVSPPAIDWTASWHYTADTGF